MATKKKKKRAGAKCKCPSGFKPWTYKTIHGKRITDCLKKTTYTRSRVSDRSVRKRVVNSLTACR